MAAVRLLRSTVHTFPSYEHNNAALYEKVEAPYVNTTVAFSTELENKYPDTARTILILNP